MIHRNPQATLKETDYSINITFYYDGHLTLSKHSLLTIVLILIPKVNWCLMSNYIEYLEGIEIMAIKQN